MPSIFIWKSDVNNTSKENIRIYSGSNWMLEENKSYHNSYIYLDQIVISESNELLIAYHTKKMPYDWVGSKLLEMNYVPYQHIKSDNYGTLEMVGDWMRFTSNNETDFDATYIKREINNIKAWIHQKTTPEPFLDIQKIQDNFQEFLIKYTLPTIGVNNILIDTNPKKSQYTTGVKKIKV